MSYTSPQILDTFQRIISSVPYYYEHIEPFTQVKLERKASILFVSVERMSKLNVWVNSQFDTYPPTTQQLSEFLGMQTLIKVCADNAENIKNEFLSLNIRLFAKTLDDRIILMKSDFMKLKDSFMEFLKKNSNIKTLEKYNSNQKMKSFRKDINRFVLDRNIYTHGQLHLLKPEWKFVIEYIDSGKADKVYAVVTKEMLIEYNQFYLQILDLVDDFKKANKLYS